MFKTADGQTLELAPWRMRRLLGLVAEARRYTSTPPPQVLMRDLRAIIGHARLVGNQPAIGTARLKSAGACCHACLLARQRRGVLELLGMEIVAHPATPPARGHGEGYGRGYEREGEFESEFESEYEYESMPRSARIELEWTCWPTLKQAFEQSSGAGVYILRRGGVPVYVGISDTLGQRLREHYLNALRMRSGGLSACVARIARPGALRAVEHALVRLFGPGVTNDMLQRPLRVGRGGLSINNLLPDVFRKLQPAGNRLYLRAGEQYEWLP